MPTLPLAPSLNNGVCYFGNLLLYLLNIVVFSFKIGNLA